MDEEAVHQQRFREADEASTAKRALILGVPYRDMTNEEATIPLIQGMMEISDMYRYKMIPLAKGSYITPSIYGITLDTPESRLKEINAQAERDSESVRYEVISNSSFRNIMRRYDPPKNVVYHDVQISSEGDSDTIHKVSIELDEVRPDDILNYLILQADKLGASDIHLEHQRDQVRVRFRIDGALHPVATLSHDKYRVLFSSIASAANLSTAAMEAQSGHIVREIGELRKSFQLLDKSGQVYQAEADDHTLNMRIETVPTMYGQDAVIRLFNFRSEMLSLDVLGLDDKEYDAWVENVRRSGTGPLTRADYLKLARPSINENVRKYASVAPDLYQRIRLRCVEEDRMCSDMIMAIDAQGGLGRLGVDGVVREAINRPAHRGEITVFRSYVSEALCAPMMHATDMQAHSPLPLPKPAVPAVPTAPAAPATP